MSMLLRNITVPIDETDAPLEPIAAHRLRVKPELIASVAIVHRSIDARKRDRILLVYHLEVALVGGPRKERHILRMLHRKDVVALPDPAKVDPTIGAGRRGELPHGSKPLAHRPIIIGFGPAGMFAALWLARHGYRPLVLERGQAIKTRHRDILERFYQHGDFDGESNLLFGEGGAGAYSDGKLFTRVKDPRMRDILSLLVEHGGSPDILVDARPHLGSDRIPTICGRIRETIESLGGEVRFGARLDGVTIEAGRVTAIQCGTETIPCDTLLLGIGHSARDTIHMLARSGIPLQLKPFQMGVRVEHPQSLVDRWQYGEAAGHPKLPPAEYHVVAKHAADLGAPLSARPGDSLSAGADGCAAGADGLNLCGHGQTAGADGVPLCGQGRTASGDVYSFCMCPGGMILPTPERPGRIVTNGASKCSRNSPFANSALVLTLPPGHVSSDPLAVLAWLDGIERAAFEATGNSYRVPAQRGPDFLADRPSDGTLETTYPLGGEWVKLDTLLPPFLTQSLRRALADLDRRMPGFAGADCLIVAPETRASSPIRILRDADSLCSPAAEGFYPMGEGAGYAGGIMSAALDGIITAEKIISSFAPRV